MAEENPKIQEKQKAPDPAKNSPEELMRLRKDFIPAWPNSFFERAQSSEQRFIALLAFVAILGGMGVILLFAHGQAGPAVRAILLFAAFTVLYAFSRKHVIRRLKMPGTMVTAAGTERTDLFGQTHLTTYEVWREGYRERGVQLTEQGFVFRAGREKLVFSFEVGDAAMQKHIMECYRDFGAYLGEELPPMNRTSIDLIDHRHFYRRSRVNQMIVLLIASLFFFGAVASREIILIGGAFLFLLPIELTALYTLFRGARLTEETTGKLLAEKGTELVVKEGEKKTGYRFYAACLIALAAVNTLIICFS